MVLRITVVNDTAIPVRVLCAVCGPSGFALAPLGRRTLTPGNIDRLMYKRPGKVTCLTFGTPTGAGSGGPPSQPVIVKVS